VLSSFSLVTLLLQALCFDKEETGTASSVLSLRSSSFNQVKVRTQTVL
jgi:hypothetical protein